MKFAITNNCGYYELRKIPKDDSDWLWQNPVYACKNFRSAGILCLSSYELQTRNCAVAASVTAARRADDAAFLASIVKVPIAPWKALAVSKCCVPPVG